MKIVKICLLFLDLISLYYMVDMIKNSIIDENFIDEIKIAYFLDKN